MRRFFRDNVWEFVGTVGALSLFAGLWWLHPAAALIASGAGLITLALWGAKAWAS